MAFSMTSCGNNVFEIGAFDAKTYFSELLRKVQDGTVINISKNGKKVAVLQGSKSMENKNALDAHNRILLRAKRMSEERVKNGSATMTMQEVEELKNNGRK